MVVARLSGSVTVIDARCIVYRFRRSNALFTDIGIDRQMDR